MRAGTGRSDADPVGRRAPTRTPTVLRRAALRIGLAVILAVAVIVVVVHVTGSSRSCTRSALLVPNCTALWGIATDPNTSDAVRSVERKADAHFDLVYRFHDLNDTFPTADERSLVSKGYVLHITISPTIFGTSRSATWRQIAAGAFDRQLSAQARGVASLGVPVFLTFDHESDRPDRAVRGSATDFIAAWRHVHDLYAAAGARKTVWVWVVTGYPPFFARAGAIWPGNRYVDWISWEAYNGSGCAAGSIHPSALRSFGSVALQFLHWVHKTGARYGIDANKPMMISEAGSVVYRGDPGRTADWYAKIPEVLAHHRQIRAVTLWDRPGNGDCTYTFDRSAQVSAAVGRAITTSHNSRPPTFDSVG